MGPSSSSADVVSGTLVAPELVLPEGAQGTLAHASLFGRAAVGFRWVGCSCMTSVRSGEGLLVR